MIDADGTIDLIFPTCDGGNCEIHIAHNEQIPICDRTKNVDCRSKDDLCVADDKFSFNFDVSVFKLEDFLPNEKLVLFSESHNQRTPIPLHIGNVVV
jgi:integrin alpha FG-GAP repeat containing protein 1